MIGCQACSTVPDRRRWVAGALSALAAVASLSACTGGSSTPPEQQAARRFLTAVAAGNGGAAAALTTPPPPLVPNCRPASPGSVLTRRARGRRSRLPGPHQGLPIDGRLLRGDHPRRRPGVALHRTRRTGQVRELVARAVVTGRPESAARTRDAPARPARPTRPRRARGLRRQGTVRADPGRRGRHRTEAGEEPAETRVQPGGGHAAAVDCGRDHERGQGRRPPDRLRPRDHPAAQHLRAGPLPDLQPGRHRLPHQHGVIDAERALRPAVARRGGAGDGRHRREVPRPDRGRRPDRRRRPAAGL